MNWGGLLKSMLHAVYGGAITGLIATSNGAISLKKIALSLGMGAFTGLVHWFSDKSVAQ